MESMESSNRLTRSKTDVMIGGVCGGLGQYFKIDATLVRLAFVLLTLAGGSGVLVYFILWIVIPREDLADSSQAMNSDEFGRRANLMGQEMQQFVSKPNTRTVQFIGIGLVFLGIVYLIQNLHIPWLVWFNDRLLWPILIIAVGALLLSRAFKRP
jgi:phage shock protein PspC (stress-responsive transcriptional regulator)